jgi:hypothetical protein
VSGDKVDVLAVIAEAADFVEGFVGDELQEGIDELLAGLRETRAAVAELIEADVEHDTAREALVALNRRIAEHGWIDIEHDALRKAGERFVRAQSRRIAALARVQS